MQVPELGLEPTAAFQAALDDADVVLSWSTDQRGVKVARFPLAHRGLVPEAVTRLRELVRLQRAEGRPAPKRVVITVRSTGERWRERL